MAKYCYLFFPPLGAKYVSLRRLLESEDRIKHLRKVLVHDLRDEVHGRAAAEAKVAGPSRQGQHFIISAK